MPPSTMTSASETLAQVTPMAPSSIWRRAIHGDLWPLECGRQSLPPAAMAVDRRRTFASKRSRSSSSAGVSSSPRVMPTVGEGDGAVPERVDGTGKDSG